MTQLKSSSTNCITLLLLWRQIEENLHLTCLKFLQKIRIDTGSNIHIERGMLFFFVVYSYWLFQLCFPINWQFSQDLISFSLMSFTGNKMGRRKPEYKEKQQGLKIILHYHPFSERHVSLILHEAAERIVDSKIPGKNIWLMRRVKN